MVVWDIIGFLIGIYGCRGVQGFVAAGLRVQSSVGGLGTEDFREKG